MAPTSTWIDVCRRFGAEAGVGQPFLSALDAFAHPHPRGGPPAPAEAEYDGTFEALERRLAQTLPSPEALGADLEAEVDAGQAMVFARRLHAVDRILSHFGDPTGRLLAVGLRHRLGGILAAPRPHALRVRALADFYYSYAGRHHHQRHQRALGSWQDALPAVRWTAIAPGVERATLQGAFAEGPTHVNLLRVEPGAVRFEALDCRHCTPPGGFEALVVDRGALAAVSGGFFLYSETGIEPPERRYDPVGLLMPPGEVVNPPVFARGGLAVTPNGEVAIERISVAGMEVRWGEHRVALAGLCTRAHHERGPDTHSVSIAGQRVVGVGRSLRIPIGGFVLPLPADVTATPGARVRYTAPRLADGRSIHTGIAGGPLLLHDGRIAIDLAAEDFWGEAPPITFSQDETGDRNLLPRLAAGLDDRDRLVLAAIDGRNFDRALGMTLRDTAELLRGLGCHRATNLDGGSSKRMVVQGQTLDLASTEIDVGQTRGLTAVSVRPVYTALLMHRAAVPAP